MPQSFRVGINVLFLLPNKVGGTEYYTRSFLRELHDLKDQKNIEYVVFCNQENASTFSFSRPNWKIVRCPVSAQNRLARVLYEYLVLPWQVWWQQCLVLHSFGYTTPKVWSARNLVTIHDANWKDHPEDVSWISRVFLNRIMQYTLWAADLVVTDSLFSAKRLKELFPAKQKSIQVLSPGVDTQFLELLKQKQSVPAKTPSRYLFCVSAFYPHKKILSLLDIWEKIAEQEPTLWLVLVGQNGADASAVQQRIAQLPRVLSFAKVPYKELVGLYQQAELFVFPSVYEGFGFPVYEAVAAKLPVFVGNAACYDPAIQPHLHALSFHREKDAQQILAVLGKKKSFIPGSILLKHSYTQSAQKLQKLYRV